MVSVSFWHATGTVCSPPGLASPSVHKYKAQHDYKNDAEHKHQAANAEAMTRLRDQRDTGHRNTVPRECYAQRGCTVSRYVLNTRRSTHWSPYRLGPWPMRSARLHGPPRPDARHLVVLARSRALRVGVHPLAVGHPPGSWAKPPGSRWSAPLDERPWPGGFGLLGLSWLMASGWTSTTSTQLLPWCLLCPVHP